MKNIIVLLLLEIPIFPPFPLENRLRSSWMTIENLPLPFGCARKDLRLGSGLCHSISLLAKDAGNKGTTRNAESFNKEMEKKMRMQSKFSLGGEWPSQIPDRNK